jgi:hypothetical protein
MYITLRQSIIRLPIFIIAAAIGFFCVPIIFSLIHPDSIAAQEPVRETARFIGENWKLPIVAGLLYLLFIQVCSAARFLRLPLATRTLTYSADAVGMRFTDGQGSSAQMPWTTIRKATRTTRYIILRMKVGRTRFIALKAFADSERLWKLVATNVPTRG